jgi:hypothetical protein
MTMSGLRIYSRKKKDLLSVDLATDSYKVLHSGVKEEVSKSDRGKEGERSFLHWRGRDEAEVTQSLWLISRSQTWIYEGNY